MKLNCHLGLYVRGNWESEEDGGHRNQNYELQCGYTGIEEHAMSFHESCVKLWKDEN